MVNMTRMQAQLVLHEGLKLEPYKDTEDNWTILVGYNLDARGWDAIEHVLGRTVQPPASECTADEPFGHPHLTHADAMAVLKEDITRYWSAMLLMFPEVVALNEVRQRVCLDMAFNMGYHALGFKQCIAAIKRKDWSTAARELYKSKWARQVGDGPGGRVDRCDRLSQMLLTGNDYTV